jgi:hypothetical protein
LNHEHHGTATFTLIKDQMDMWKVCNIAIFGDTENGSVDQISSHASHDIFANDFLRYLNGENTVEFFSHPYQYIFPPFALKTSDPITTYMKLCRSKGGSNLDDVVSFAQHESKAFQPRTLLASPTLSLREINVTISTEARNVSNVIDLLVFSRPSSMQQTSAGADIEGSVNSRSSTVNCILVAKILSKDAGDSSC